MASSDNQCNIKSDQQKPPKVDGLAAYLKAMGAQACNTSMSYDSTSGSLHADANAGPMGIMGSVHADASFSTTKESSTSVGCEQIIAQSNAYNDTVNNVKCQLNKISSSGSSNIITNQVMTISETAEIKCGRDSIFDLSAKIKANVISSLSSKDQTTIANTIQKGLAQVNDAQQEAKNGFGSTSHGQKTLSDNKTNLLSSDMASKISDQVASSISNVMDNQTFEFKGKLNSSRDCKFSQDMVVTVLAQSMVSSSFDAAFNEDLKQDILQSASAKQEAVNEAAPTNAPPMNYAEAYGLSKNFMLIGIVGISIFFFFIVLIVIYKLFMNNSSHNDLQESHNDLKKSHKSHARKIKQLVSKIKKK